MAADLDRRRARAFASLACIFALARVAAPAGAQCEPTPSIIELCGVTGHPLATWYSYDPAFSQFRLCGPICNFEGCDNPAGASATFDHVAGTLSATALRGSYIDVGLARVGLNDFYWLEGPPSANPVSVRVRLAVAVTGCLPRRGDYGLLAGYATSGETRPYGELYFTDCHPEASALVDTIVVEKLVAVGNQFPVQANVSIEHGLNASATISGALTFTPPPGYQVRSCKGDNAPVPAQSSSWGALKLRYR